METIKYLWATCYCEWPPVKWIIFFVCLSGISCAFFSCAIAYYPVTYPEKSMVLLSWLYPAWFFRHGQDRSLWGTSSPGWAVSAPLVSLCLKCSNSSVITVLIPVCWYLSCVGESRAGPSTPDVFYHSWEQAKDHLQLAGHALLGAAQGAAALHCCKSIKLAHG